MTISAPATRARWMQFRPTLPQPNIATVLPARTRAVLTAVRRTAPQDTAAALGAHPEHESSVPDGAVQGRNAKQSSACQVSREVSPRFGLGAAVSFSILTVTSAPPASS